MTASNSNKENFEIRSARNGVRTLIWTLTWTVSIALMAFGPKLIWDFNLVATSMAVIISLLAGYKMILVNKDLLLGLDEMQQKIQLNAMAISLGAGLVLGVTYETFEDIKIITFEPEISHLIIAMTMVYILSIFIGNRRYA
jgi:hypothetical protein